jgi:hypothetical protein
MSKSKIKAALADIPKKPNNAYFKLRIEKMKEYSDDPKFDGNKSDAFKTYWEGISDKQKDEWKEEYQAELDEYKQEYDDWLKKHDLEEEDVKQYKKKVKDNE